MAAAVAEEVPMTDLRESPMALFRSQVTEDEKSSSLGGVDVSAEEGRSRKMKKPKRILHFSDGTLEEYSTDEEDETDKQQELDPLALVDPKSLTWGPWMYYWMLYTGSSALAACDYVGESLANFLGITSPKYQYEIDEYHRSLQEEKERKEEEDAEMAGWRSPGSTNEANTDQGVPISSIQQPSSLHGLNEQDFQLLYRKGSDTVEVSSIASSSFSQSSFSQSSFSFSSSSSPSPTTKDVKMLVSKVQIKQATEMSTWV